MINQIRKVFLLLTTCITLFTLYSNESKIVKTVIKENLFNHQTSEFEEYYITNFDGDLTYITNIISVNEEVYLVGQSQNLVTTDSKMDSFLTKVNADGQEDVESRLRIDNNLKNDTINGICVDSNDNIYISGYFQDENLNYDLWIKKIRYIGNEINIIWDIKIDLNNTSTFPIENSLQVDNNDNLFVIATDNNKWVIKKFDSYGNEDLQHWNKRVGKNQGLNWPKDIAIDTNGNVYVIGVIQNISTDELDFDWLIKVYSNDGIENIKNWNKQIDANKKWDKPFSIEIENTEIYISGYGSNLISETSDYDWWIKKFTLDGIEVWSNIIGKNNSQETIVSSKIYNGSLFIAGAEDEDHMWGIKSISLNGDINKDVIVNNDSKHGLYTITDLEISNVGSIYLSGIFYYKVGEKFKSKGFIRKY